MIASRQPQARKLSLGGVPIARRPMVTSSAVPQAAGAPNAPEVRSPTSPHHDAVDIGDPMAGSAEVGIAATAAVTVGLGMVIALLWVVAGVLVIGALVAGIVFGVDGVVGVRNRRAPSPRSQQGAASQSLWRRCASKSGAGIGAERAPARVA